MSEKKDMKRRKRRYEGLSVLDKALLLTLWESVAEIFRKKEEPCYQNSKMIVFLRLCKYLYFEKRAGCRAMGEFLESIGLEPEDIGLVFMLIGMKWRCSWSIDGVHFTLGYGNLDEWGFWQYPAFWRKYAGYEESIRPGIGRGTWRLFCRHKRQNEKAIRNARAQAEAAAKVA